MARTLAKLTHGAIISVKRVGGAYVPLIEVTNFTGPEGRVTDVRATHLGSDSGTHEFIPGLNDAGQLDIDFNTTPDGIEDIEDWYMAREVCDVKIVLPDMPSGGSSGSILEFKGYANRYKATDGQLDDKMSGSLGIKVAGPITFTKAV